MSTDLGQRHPQCDNVPPRFEHLNSTSLQTFFGEKQKLYIKLQTAKMLILTNTPFIRGHTYYLMLILPLS